MRRTLAARQRANDHELAREARGRLEITRKLAIEKDLDVRSERPLLVNDPEFESRVSRVEFGERVGECAITLRFEGDCLGAPGV